MKTLLVLTLVALSSFLMQAETYLYDDAGRVIAVRYDNGMETRYTYDKNSNITQVKTGAVNSVAIVSETFGITVSPVPASDKLVLSNVPDADIQLTITSVTGEQVLSTKIQIIGVATVNVENLAPGVYALRASKRGVTQTAMIVIN